MDLKLLKMLCKDSKQHHVIFHELCSVSSLLCIAQNVRSKSHTKSYILKRHFNDIQILCLGFLCVNAGSISTRMKDILYYFRLEKRV